MTAILARLIGRMPIGWLQLTHNKTRMAAALAGVAFANMLVFVQLGILGGLNATIVLTYDPLRADILISASDANTLTDGSPLARQRMYQALAVPGVADAAPLYLAMADWIEADGSSTSLQVYGLPPEAHGLVNPSFASGLTQLRLPNTALLDGKTRGLDLDAIGPLSAQNPQVMELNGVTVDAIGTFDIGAGFAADGNLLVSDQTFLRMFGGRVAGTPSHILVSIEDGASLSQMVARLQENLASDAVIIRSLEQAQSDDLSYQNTERPTGLIFGFGVIMGVIVGLVIVYQVLATDVADHLREYATFKAMGYRQSFFLGVVLEEAVVLAVLGFIPGLLLSLGIYAAMSTGTGLPIIMDPQRAISVLLGTIAACALSGAVATRRLAGADPADLF